MVFLKDSKDEMLKYSAKDFSEFRKENKYSEGNGVELMAAVDIGTTCVAVELYVSCVPRDYEDRLRESGIVPGRYVAGTSEKNVQTIMGADVMMRLMHCINGAADRLHAMIVNQVEKLIDICIASFTAIAGEMEIKLTQISVVGNSPMCHIFLNEDVEGLAHAPFTLSYKGLKQVRGEDIGFKRYIDTEVSVLPPIASHVGADALSAMCECRLDNDEYKCALMVDIGTNAEIILKHGNDIYAVSVAAGPAFEGYGTQFGMRAGAGAINMVRFAPVNDMILIDMIEGDEVKGICASGYIDIISQLVRYDLLTEDGYLLTESEAYDISPYIYLADRMYDFRGKQAFLVCGINGKNDSCIKRGKVYNGDNDKSKSIYLTQDDVRTFQLAKAAICAGIKILLKKAGVTASQIERVFVAGMLGNSISIDECINIGLFPQIDSKAFKMVGNAALSGAARALFDKAFLSQMEKNTDIIKHIELADDEDFQDEYINSFDLSPVIA